MKPIYLDYASTTPMAPAVADKMRHYLTMEGHFGNPASLHDYGRAALAAIETAREQVAAMIGALPAEMIWTSGATESNNLALKGAAALYQGRGKHIIVWQTEHKSVLDSCHYLEKEGYQLTYLKPQANGQVDQAAFVSALRPDTMLVSIMHVNNETGVWQDLAAIANITASRNILLHVDAAQSIGKRAIHVNDIPIDLLSLSAHKIYGPKGIGALYIRKKPRVRVMPLLHGGGHEQGMRSGTLATHQIVGMGEAFALARDCYFDDEQHMHLCRARFINGLKVINNWHLNTDVTVTVPHIVNMGFDNMLAHTLLEKLPGIALSTASTCQAKGSEGSHVLRAMGFADDRIQRALRFSFGRFTTLDEIDRVVAMITQASLNLYE